MTSSTVLIAVGGNALIREGEPGSLPLQATRAHELAANVADVLDAGWAPVITHGNGPQVGYILRRGEIAAREAAVEQLPDLPLWLAVADSQGGIGHIVAAALHDVLPSRGHGHAIAAVITHSVIDVHDPAFGVPDKPIGGLLDARTAANRRASSGWDLVELEQGSFRRVVPSPRPLEILELRAIRDLMLAGVVVVAAGGGGIPVVREPGGLRAVDAVIDKDRASALLAAGLGIDTLMLVTGIDRVFLDFRGPHERPLDHVTADEAIALAAQGHFAAGSMGPKVESAIAFVRAGGRQAIITSIENVAAALDGTAGTRIVGASAAR